MQKTVQYEYKESLIDLQNKSEEAILKEFNNGIYTVEKPLIKLNPYLINPLSALLLFRTERRQAVTLIVYGKETAGNIVHTFPANTNHILPVLGLYANYDNKVSIRLQNGKEHIFVVKTEPLKEDAPELISMQTTSEYMRGDMIFLTPSLAALATAFDYRGDVRWHLNVPMTFDMKRLKNGNILIGTERVIHMPYYMSGLYEMNLIGKILKEYSIPGGYHHDQWEMEDGNLLILTEDPDFQTVEDIIVLIDRKTGKILKRWDLKNCLTPGDGPSGGYTDKDWFHNNALWYDKNTNSIILSGRHTDSIISIDYDTGDLNWILGDSRGWSEEKQKYFFIPDNSNEFDWHYEQHACLMTPDGDIMCFDNGHYRSKLREEFRLNKDIFSRGVRYRINQEDMSVSQIWQYGKERGQEFFSSYIGNVECYADNHYMVHSGGIQYYGENASEHPAALMQNDPAVRAECITVEIFDNKVMMELKVKGNFYRAEKLSLYTPGSNLQLGKGIQLGKLGITPEMDVTVPCELSNEVFPYRYEASVVEEKDRLVFKAIFEGGQLVLVNLESEDEVHSYFVSTAKNKFNALCCGTFIEKDPRSITLNINKEGLRGEYKVRVIVDDLKYETGITVSC